MPTYCSHDVDTGPVAFQRVMMHVIERIVCDMEESFLGYLGTQPVYCVH